MTAPKPKSFAAVIKALTDCIAEAPSEQQEALAQALEAYAAAFPNGYRDMTSSRAAPALSGMVLLIAETVEARIGAE